MWPEPHRAAAQMARDPDALMAQMRQRLAASPLAQKAAADPGFMRCVGRKLVLTEQGCRHKILLYGQSWAQRPKSCVDSGGPQTQICVTQYSWPLWEHAHSAAVVPTIHALPANDVLTFLQFVPWSLVFVLRLFSCGTPPT